MSNPAEPASPSTQRLGRTISVEQIREGAARHLAVTTGAKAAAQLLRIGTTLVLARLLTPGDFGVLAMVMSTVGIAELLRDLGLSQATMRAANISHGQVNTLFWINIALGAAMMALCLLLSPWFGTLLADPRATSVAAVISLNFPLNALAAQHFALMRRDLRFGEIARITLTSALAGSIAALALAAFGAAYWALVASILVTASGNLLGAWRRSGWRPTAPSYDPAASALMSFGGHLAGFGLLSYLAQNAHVALIGRMFGAGAAGLYVRASTLLSQPLSYALDPLTTIVPPALSRLQDRPAELREHYLRALAPLMRVAAPVSFWLALNATDTVHVLLGPQWSESARVLSLLATATVPQVLSYTSGWLYLARGDSRGMLRWGAVGWTVVILCMLIGLSGGIEGVAASYALSMFLIVLPCMHYACRGTALRLNDLWRASWRPVVAAGLSMLVSILVLPQWQAWTPLLRLLGSGSLFAAAYLAVLGAMPSERADLAAALRSLRGARS